jgi:hypothetical protein
MAGEDAPHSINQYWLNEPKGRYAFGQLLELTLIVPARVTRIGFKI